MNLIKRERFNRIVMEWFRTNFWNPFPCDTVFSNLVHNLVSSDCLVLTISDAKKLIDLAPPSAYLYKKDIAIEKLTNFLINTRTRKWRPAVEKAFDLRRPASMLLEDALAIFDGD